MQSLGDLASMLAGAPGGGDAPPSHQLNRLITPEWGRLISFKFEDLIEPGASRQEQQQQAAAAAVGVAPPPRGAGIKAGQGRGPQAAPEGGAGAGVSVPPGGSLKGGRKRTLSPSNSGLEAMVYE